MISRVVNRLSCCGTVTLTRDRLGPGESTEVGVAIRVVGRFGELNHETAIEIDPPSIAPLILSTRATLYSPIRVEEITSDGNGSRCFLASAYGTEPDPPVDLDLATLTTRLKAQWQGAAESSWAQDGLLTCRRRSRVDLDQDGPAGIRRETVVLRQGESPIHEHPLTWEVIPSVQASPPSLLWKPGQRAYSLVLKSRDSDPFQITGVESTWSLSSWIAKETGTAGVQKLAVEVDRVDAHSRRGELLISTNRADRPSIVVPILSLD